MEGQPLPMEAERYSDVMAEFGDINIEKVPLDKIIDLPLQMRRSIDEAGLEDLKDSIRPNITLKSSDERGQTLRFNLVNPVTINVLDADHIEQYLSDHASYYDIEIDPAAAVENLSMYNGKYYVRVAGHMRGLAMKELCDEYGISTNQALTSATISENESFIEANQTQNIENRRVKVSPVDYAESIALFYEWQKAHDLPSDNGTIAEYFGYSQDRVRTALLFVTAPESIKNFVGNGLTYTNVVNLVRLREAYEKRDYQKAEIAHEVADRETIANEAAWYMQDYFERMILKRLRGKKTREIDGIIQGEINTVDSAAMYVQDEFELLDVPEMRERGRQQSVKNLGNTALQVIKYLGDGGQLTSEQIKGLEDAVERAKHCAESSASMQAGVAELF